MQRQDYIGNSLYAQAARDIISLTNQFTTEGALAAIDLARAQIAVFGAMNRSTLGKEVAEEPFQTIQAQ